MQKEMDEEKDREEWMDTRMPLPHEIPTFAPKKNGFHTFRYIPPGFRLWECISYLEGNARMGGWTDTVYR